LRFRIPFFSPGRSQQDLQFIRFFIDKFGYRPRDLDLFYEATTHRSVSHSLNMEYSNERLEFLGDSILDSIIAELLFRRFPQEDEGYLTKVKSKVVSRKTLSEIGGELELRRIIRYNKGRSINLSSLEGNAFEAIIGAIYLDSSYETVKKVIQNHVFRKYIDLNKILQEEIDFKSRLFIWCQKRRLSLEFNVIREENIGGSWKYEVMVRVNGTNYGKGMGSSKKSAEQAAAQETLILMGDL
jgi:ribonuclease III